jgi:hypothetical protein
VGRIFPNFFPGHTELLGITGTAEAAARKKANQLQVFGTQRLGHIQVTGVFCHRVRIHHVLTSPKARKERVTTSSPYRFGNLKTASKAFKSRLNAPKQPFKRSEKYTERHYFDLTSAAGIGK